MRVRIAVLSLCALALPLSAGAAAPLVVAFQATTHTPKVNHRWPWSIGVTRAGKPVAATISAAIVDPIGGVHPVEYGCCKGKFITNVKIRGRFSDWVLYPLSAKGYRLTFRLTVKTALARRVVSYWVKAQ